MYFADDETSRVSAVEFKDGNVYLTLANGVIVGNPLSWRPWLDTATDEQRAHVELYILSVYFPDLDDGIDVEGMLKGKSTSARTTVQTANAEHAGD